MGVEPQETRGIPRNRKCGNCRFYEPAPLWRKGWCRNTKLYPPHANHLVDANTIDCEGGFRSRIYWEPLAAGQVAPSSQPEPRPVAPTNVTPITPLAANAEPVPTASASNNAASANPPINPIIGRPISHPITPSADAYLRPMDEPSGGTYKHPLADRSFAKSGDDTIRPVNTTPAPIISRQSAPVPSQNLNQDNPTGPGSRAPFTPPAANEPSDNSYRPFGVRSNRSFSSQEPPTRSFSSQDAPTRNFSSQEPASRNFSAQESNSRNYTNSQEPPNNRNYTSPEPEDRNFSAGDQPTRNFSTQERGSRSFSQEQSGGRNFSAGDTPTRSFAAQERNRPFITPPPPQNEAPNQAYGGDEDYGETETYNEPASNFNDQATRPYEAQATRPYQPNQYSQPPAEPEEWADEEPAPPPPPSRRYNETSNFSNQPGNFSGSQRNNYGQPATDYPTQPGNYSSQLNTEKEPIRIQEALPANNRPRPLEPKKQPQPVPARFRPVKEDQPAANMPVNRDWKAILREKAPFTRNWNLEGITMNRQTILPWAIGGVLVLILVVVLIANLGKKPDDQNNPTGTVAAANATTSAANGTTSGSTTTTGNATTAARTTAAGSTSATTAASTATTAPATKTATVKGTGSVLNVRDTPSTKGKVVTTVKDGEKVNIKGGPKDGDGISWYQVEYNGATGWASAAYLEL